MDPQPFLVHGQQSQLVNNPTSKTGCLTERTPPLTPYDLGLHHHVDPSFLSCFRTPPLPHLPTFTYPFSKGWVVLDSLPPENEESYAKGWYSGFIEESQAAGAEPSQFSDVEFIRNKATDQSESLGFTESKSHAAADEHQDDSHEFSVFVANLAAEATDYLLQQTFKAYYTSVKGARVVTDSTTGRSKGYGFVSFADKDEMMRSLTEMNRRCCLSRPMLIGPASTGPASVPKAIFQRTLGTPNESDPNKTTVGGFDLFQHHRVFVDGLNSDVTEDYLKLVFSKFGDIHHVKLHVGKNSGVVEFNHRECAVKAIETLHGTKLGGSKIRLSWACRSPNEQGQLGGMVHQHADLKQCNMYRYDGSYADYGYFLANMFSFQGCAGPEHGYKQHQQH